MPSYTPPLRDMQFVMHELFKVADDFKAIWIDNEDTYESVLRFVERSFPSSERPFFTRLLGEIFKTMRLAGEAGSLLKIEDDVSALVADARAQWKKIGKRDGDFFSQAELVNLDRRTILQDRKSVV